MLIVEVLQTNHFQMVIAKTPLAVKQISRGAAIDGCLFRGCRRSGA
jgi:hypothetical protein